MVCRMKSLQVQRGYICLPSLCLHYVELNKRIISKTAAMVHRRMRRSAILIGAAASISDEWRKTLDHNVVCRHVLIVVSCNLWEFRAMAFDKIPHHPI